MCLIIVKDEGKTVPKEVIKTSARINPHGLGVVWLDTFEINYHKSKEYKILFSDRPFIAHFRYATVGKIGKDNTHPFVCGDLKHEYLMMNGHICNLGNERDCDSKVLAMALGKVPRHTWKHELSKYHCRFTTVNVRNRSYQIYNKHLWTQVDGVWYSKDNVFEDNLIAVYGTLKKGNGNYYNYLSDSKFIGHGKTADKYPLIIEGLPYLCDAKGVGKNVDVDVFKVSDSVLASIDRLEGHPTWYKRKPIEVNVNGKKLTCWAYMMDATKSIGKTHHESYGYKQNGRTEWSFDADWSVSERVDELDREIEADMNGNPMCTLCFSDIESDAYGCYYCHRCEEWFTENQIIK